MTQHRGSIVYLGAGLCSDLEDHLISNPERIYLVEPNPALRDELTQLCEKHPIVEHLACGVTPEGGQKSLNVYNFFDLSSFSAPDTLLEIYPGALVDATPQVSTLTPADLLAQLNLHPKASNTLILETTGIEHAVLDAFATSGVLQSFSTLSLKMPAHTLFHGSRSIEDIDALVEGAGYWKSAQLDVSDNPDWHQCTYTFDRQAHLALKEQQVAVETAATETAQTIATLKKQSADLHAEREKAREQLATAKENAAAAATETAQTIATLKKQSADLHAEREKAREQLATAKENAAAAATETAQTIATLKKQSADLHAERDKAREQLATAKENAAATATETAQTIAMLKKQSADLHAERDKAREQLATAKENAAAAATETAQTIATLKKQSADLHAEREKAREQLATAKENAAAQSKDAIAKVADLATQNASLNKEVVMALRIQARLQSNQQDLQTRFTAMQNEKHAQDELVTALVQKLEDMLASTPAKATKSRKKRTLMTKGASRKKAAGT